MDAEKIYDGVRKKRGEVLVCMKAIEEMGELSAVLSKFLGEDEMLIERVQEEIADVSIMMEQLRLVFFPTIIDRNRIQKLQRLAQRLEGWNDNQQSTGFIQPSGQDSMGRG